MNDFLKQSLTFEARSEQTPAFSDALHARTLARLAAARRGEVAIEPGLRPRANRAPAIMALFLLLAVGMAGWLSLPGGVSENGPPIVVADPPPAFVPLMASLGDGARPLVDLAGEPHRLAADQFVLLRDDASRFGAFVAGQFPTLPATTQ